MNKNEDKITHGECVNGTSKLYKRWSCMKERILKPNNKRYKDYGGRGITICDEWLIPSNFIKWAKENGYREDLILDREDVNGNYCPQNCRWVTAEISSLNKRKKSDFGISKNKNRYNVSLTKVGNGKRVYFGGSFITIEEARINRDKLFRILHYGSEEIMNPSRYHIWKESEIEILKNEYANGITHDLAKKLGFTEDQIRGKASEFRLKKTQEAWVESHIIHGKYRQIK